MPKNKKTLAILLILLLVLVVGVFVFIAKNRTKAEGNSSTSSIDIIFFYGEECPHCKTVERFLEDEKVSEKVKFEEKEVYHNQANQAVLREKARECGYTDHSIPVPFLWTKEGKCLIGDKDIINYFSELIGETVDES